MLRLMCILTLIIPLAALGQKEKDTLVPKKQLKNAVYVQFGGTGVFYTINYERVLLKREKYSINASTGFNFIPNWGYNISNNSFLIPNSVSVLLGKRRSKFEIKASVSLQIDPEPYPKTWKERREFPKSGIPYGDPDFGVIYKPLILPVYSPAISYRYDADRFFGAISYTPLIWKTYDMGRPGEVFAFYLWGGISIGYKF